MSARLSWIPEAKMNATKVGKAVLNAMKEETAVKGKDPLDFYTQKLGLKVVKKNIKVKLPVASGMKTFTGVQFDNGRTAVYCRRNSYLKYAWN